VVSEIQSRLWQMDTCIGGRFYDRRAVCKITADIVHMLVNIVSKNGNLLLNIRLRRDGTFDDEPRQFHMIALHAVILKSRPRTRGDRSFIICLVIFCVKIRTLFHARFGSGSYV
jgi:hypothetical protein